VFSAVSGMPTQTQKRSPKNSSFFTQISQIFGRKFSKSPLKIACYIVGKELEPHQIDAGLQLWLKLSFCSSFDCNFCYLPPPHARKHASTAQSIINVAVCSNNDSETSYAAITVIAACDILLSHCYSSM
jgi:uncharacterized radical SAM superfamily Fe-S cluster-containing enzyme